MEKEAILHIGAMSHAPVFLEHVQGISQDRPFALLPEAMTINDMEKYLATPVRFRNAFKTYRISEFVRYCCDFGTEAAQCIIFADELSFRSNPQAITTFDKGKPGEPLHGEHRAKVELQKLPEYQIVIDFDGNTYGQKELAEWMEEYAENIEVFTSDGSSMTAVLAARAVRDMSIKAARQTANTVHDFSESRSISESIEAENADAKPAAIKFTFTPYPGFETYTVEFRLSVITSGETPKFKPRMLRQDRLIQAIADEFTEKVTSGIKNSKIAWYLGA